MKRLLLTFIGISSLFFSYATTFTSTAAGGNWNTGASWVGGVAPTGLATDVVIIVGPINLTAVLAGAVNSVTINSGGTLDLHSALSIGAGGITINSGGTFTQSSASLTISGPWLFNTGATFNPGTNRFVSFGTGGSIGGTAATTFTTLIINTTASTDVVPLLTSGATIKYNSGGGTLNLTNGIFKIGTGNTLYFNNNSNSNGITNLGGSFASSANGFTDADGGTVVLLTGSGANFLITGGTATTFYNLYFGGPAGTAVGSANRTVVQSNPNSVIINGSLVMQDNNSQWTTNAPIYGPNSTLYINNNTLAYNPNNLSNPERKEWTATSGYNIGVTAGYPNNVTIVNVGNSSANVGGQNVGFNMTTALSINGTLTMGDGTTAGNVAINNSGFFCGGITINTNSILAAGSNFTVKGSWLRTGSGASFYPLTSTVSFGGSGTCSTPNTISSPTSGSETFYGLSIINGAYVSLSSPVTVTNIFTLTSGILATTSTNILSVTNTSNTAIVGGSTSSFINGPVNWTLAANLASTSYVFPVGVTVCGTSNTYLPFTITPQTSTSSVTATVQAFGTGSGGSGATVTGLSTTEYWSLTTSASLLSGSSVSVQRPSAIAAGSVIAGSTGQASASNSFYTNLIGTVSGSGPYSITNSNSIGTTSPFYFAIANPSPVVTLPATSITTTSATLNGTYNTSGATGTTSFGWGTGSSGPGSISGTPGSITSITPTAASASLTGLIPNTVYLYKAVSTGGFAGQGADVSFTTLPNPPTVAAGTNAATTSVTTNWTAPTGQGSATFTYTVQISADATFATGVITQANIVSATTTFTFTGLSPATAYYYRVEAVNVTGPSTWSATSTISTLLAASSGCSSSGSSNAGVQYVNKNTSSALPLIDGIGTDAAWSTATSNSIANITVGGSTDINNVANGTYWKALWSVDSLYLLVQVTDPGGLVSLPASMTDGGITNPGTATETPLTQARNYYDVDGVEFVIDPDYSHGNTYDGVNDDQIRFNLGASNISGQSTGGATQFVGTAFNRMYGKVNFVMRTSVVSGNPVYVLEAKMAWSDIYGNATIPANLQNVGFDLSINDNDNAAGGRTSQVTWNSTNGNNYLNPSNFAKAVLVGCETPPTVDLPTVTTITDVSANLGATVESGGADLNGNVFTSVPIKGSAYSTTLPVTTNALAIAGALSPLPSAFTGTRTALSPQTHYYYVGYATNADDETGVSAPGSFWTLSSPPITQASSFAASQASCTGVTLNWTAATFPNPALNTASASGYIILRRNDLAFPTTAGITNGTATTQAGITAAQSGTTLVTIITSGSTATFADAGLTAGTYNYIIIPFTWNGSEDSTHNYLTVSDQTSSILLATGSIGGTAAAAQTICSGSSPASNLTLTGSGGTIQWQYSIDNFVADVHNIVGATATTLTIAQMGTLATSTYYRAVVNNGLGCIANSSIVLITVNQPSVAPTSLSATSPTLCNTGSQTTTLTQTGGSLGLSSYWQWYTDAGFTIPVGSQLFTSNASLVVTPTTTTTYYLRAEGDNSPCAPTEGTNAVSVTVTVNQPSVAPTTLNTSVTICNGGSATLTQTGGSLGTGAYWQWYSNAAFTTTVGGHLASSNASLSVSPAATTTYYLRAEGTSSPCTTTPIAAAGSVTITVNQPSVAPTSLSTTASSICSSPGGSVTLTQNGGSLGTGAYWQWYTDAGFTTPVGGQLITLNASLVVTPASTTTYYLRAEGGTSPCAAIVAAAGSVTVAVSSRPVASITSPNTSICNDGSGSDVVTVSGTITANGAWTMILNDGTTVTGTGTGVSAAWSKTISPTPTANFAYTIASLHDAFCTSIANDLTGSEAVTVSQPSKAPTSIGTTISLCLSAAGLSGSATLTQTGGSLGTGAYWQWYTDPLFTNGNQVGGQLGSANASLIVAPVVTTTYYLRAEGGTSPCSTTAAAAGSVTVTVNTLSVAPTSLSVNGAASLTQCGTANITLTQTGGSLGTGASWQWYKTSFIAANKVGGLIATANASLTVTPVAGTVVTYILRAENGTAPCATNVGATPPSVIVTTNALPTATFKTSPVVGVTTICNPTTQTLQVKLVTGATNPWTYSWSDGTTTTPVSVPGAATTTSNINVTPAATTTYTITALADKNGCSPASLPAPITLTVNQPSTAPTVLAASLNPICNPGGTTLSQTGGTLGTGATWKWYSDAGFTTLVGTSVAPDASLAVTPTITTTYYLRAEGGSAPCAATVAAIVSETVTVNQPSVAPTSLSASASPICTGGSSTLTQTGGTLGTGATWKWYSDAGFTTLVGTSAVANASLSVSPTVNTTYYLRAEGGSSPCTATVGTSAVSVTVNVNGFREWLGTTSTNWNDPTNWCGGIPDVTVNVLIPFPSPNYPNLNTGAGATKDITIQSGASVTVSSTGVLSIAGAISNSGTFDATTGTVTMVGASAQTIDGSAFVSRTINNLTISNTAVSLVATGGDTLKVSGALAFGNVNNATFTTNGNLTLTSTAANTARLADITNAGANSGNTVSGSAIIERFISSHRAWRLLTAPLATTSQTVNAAWQEGVVNTTTSGAGQFNPHPGYGTEITNLISTPPSTGYDKAVTLNPSLMYLNNSGSNWVIPTSTLGADPQVPLINSKPGYMLFVRGDRSVVVTTPPFNPSTVTTLRTKGTLNQNTISMTPPAAAANQVVGNPYASEVALDHIFNNYGATIGTNYTAWDPLLGGRQGVGAFYAVAWLGGNSYTTVNSYSPATLGRIESGQAFFFYFANTNPISFIETDKTAPSVLVFRPADAPVQSFATQLNSVNSDGSTDQDDGALELYGSQYSDSVNWLEDAQKIPNPGEMISILRDGKLLAIEKRQPITLTDTIFFNIAHMKQQTYQFAFIGAGIVVPSGLEARLQDLYLDTSKVVSLADGDTTFVNFTVNSNAASQGNRFRIVYDFPSGGPLPVTYTSIKAWQQNSNIAVQWVVNNQLNVKEYVVEKSTDGVSFTKVGTVNASTGTGSSISYNWIDANAVAGENYYRIISIGTNAVAQYSQVVKVNIGANAAPAIAVYPNPVKGGAIGLQLTNMPAGKYSIKLLDNIGQMLVGKEIIHAGGSATETIRFNSNMAKGIYHLGIVGPGGYQNDIKVMY